MRGTSKTRCSNLFVVHAIVFLACAGCASTATPRDAGIGDAAQSDAPSELLGLAARACVLMAQCNAPVSISSCGRQFLTMMYPDRGSGARDTALRLVQCGSATDCAAFRSCEIGGRAASYCAAHPGSTCDGDTLIYCGSNYNVALPCGMYGVACLGANGTANCATNEQCVDPTHTSECAGNRLIVCAGGAGAPSGFDCALGLAGGICVADGGSAQCVPSTPCSQLSSEPRCDGNVAASCMDGHDRRIDCAAANGGQCVASAATGAYALESACVPMGAVCDANTAIDRCNGTRVEGCLEGQWVGVDCRSIGLANCQDSSSGAHCVP